MSDITAEEQRIESERLRLRLMAIFEEACCLNREEERNAGGPGIESARKISDTAIIDWIEARKDGARWSEKSWLYRGGPGGPELVCAKAGENWPEGITRATWREAALAAMLKEVGKRSG